MNKLDLTDKLIYVAGHRGMVGSAICRRLKSEHCRLLTKSRSELDLRNASHVSAFMRNHKPNIVFMAAAHVGGIYANNTYPVDFLEDNLLIELNTIRSAYESGVEKLIFLASSCIYPKFAEQPIREESLLTGELESTNEWYAIAKIAGVKLCQAYRKQHGCDFISAMTANLYGIYDSFDLENSHVLPALIRKAHEAKLTDTNLEVWGSGTPRREFLYADDAADGLVFLAKHYSGHSHVNLGSGKDISIQELAKLICNITGFEGELTWDNSKPDGTPRKLMDNTKINNLGWTPTTSLNEGIKKTYDWFTVSRA